MTPPPQAQPARLKAVIFDLDGVIFDSQDANVAFYNHILEALGLPPRAEEQREIIHREAMEGALRALVGDGELLQRGLAYWRTMDTRPFVAKLTLFPQVRETLDFLAGTFQLAVATNRTSTARPALERFNLWERFSVVLTPLDVGPPKPHPAIMEATLAHLGLGREEVLYVGDSAIDEELCLAADVPLLAFRNPELRAWAHAEEFPQIPGLLGL
ncbi:MAG: HAD family hydrolase [Deltaproteobacteria bacterium]|nr:HAD family hydrolase [Deltaproteobacteria bacterium]